MDDAELDELDHQVAAALGGVLDGDGWRFDPPLDFLDGGHFIKTKRSFCRDWVYGGPIIEREKLALVPPGIYGNWVEGCWVSSWLAYANASDDHTGLTGEHVGEGATPLIAAMRAFVATSPTQQP